MIKQIISPLLPEKVYDLLRERLRQYREYKFKKKTKLTEERLCEILKEELRVKRGSVVFVHSSINKMNLDFLFLRVLDLLREIVGQEGTLLFPSTHLSERPEEYLRKEGVFDVRKSPTTMGIIPELARRQKGAYRSLHPTNSVCAIGRHAKELTENHHTSPYPCGEESPYYKIVDYDGIIIGLGVSTERLAFVHCVEDIVRDKFPVETREREIFEGKVIDINGDMKVVKTLVAHERINWRNIPWYIRKYVPKEVCRDLKIDGIQFFTADAHELYKRMKELAGQRITIYSWVKRNKYQKTVIREYTAPH